MDLFYVLPSLMILQTAYETMATLTLPPPKRSWRFLYTTPLRYLRYSLALAVCLAAYLSMGAKFAAYPASMSVTARAWYYLSHRRCWLFFQAVLIGLSALVGLESLAARRWVFVPTTTGQCAFAFVAVLFFAVVLVEKETSVVHGFEWRPSAV